MDKVLKTIRTILIIGFLVINIFFMLFNWPTYIETVDFHYGLGTFRVSPLFLTMILGIISVGLIWFIDYTKDLRGEVNSMKHNAIPEINHHAIQEMDVKLNSIQEELRSLNDKLMANEQTPDND